MKELKLKMASLQKGIMDEMKSNMDKRGFASTECNTNRITEAFASLGEMIERMGSVGTTRPSPLDTGSRNHTRTACYFCDGG